MFLYLMSDDQNQMSVADFVAEKSGCYYFTSFYNKIIIGSCNITYGK